MKRIIPFILIFTSVGLFAFTLQQSLQETLQSNPVIQERLKNYLLTKEAVQSSQSGYYPSIDLKLGAGREDVTRHDANGALTVDSSLSVYENSLTYTHNIFNGFATTNEVDAQESRALSAAYSYIETVNATAKELAIAYLEQLKNKELLGTAKENVTIDAEILQRVKKLYEAGLTTLSEVNKIESSLALAKSSLIVQQNRYLEATYNLEKVLGRQLDINTMQKPILNYKFPKTAKQAIDFAQEHNPSLLVKRYNIKAANYKYKTQRSNYSPSIDIELSGNKNKNLSALQGRNDNFKAMAYLNFNLFHGFRDSSNTQQALIAMEQESANKGILSRDIKRNINIAWSSKQKLSEQLQHLQEYTEFSKKTLTLYAKEYNLGRRSLLDLLSAQNDFINSKAQIITTKYQINETNYTLLDNMGILLQVLTDNNTTILQNVNLANQEEPHAHN